MDTTLRLRLALLAAAALAGAQQPLCLEKWRCNFQHTDSTATTWRWDLSTLCRENGTYSYAGPGSSGQDFTFNVCGNSSSVCSDYDTTAAEYESRGGAVQFFQAGRGQRTNGGCLRPDNSTCTDWTTGEPTCCSVRRCEVVAYNVFSFDVVAPENSATGGIVLTHVGYPDRENDDLACPFAKPGLRHLRSFILNLDCDPNGALDDLAFVSYNENEPYCTFRIRATTRAACGVADASASPSPSTTAAPSASASQTATPTPSPPPIVAAPAPGVGPGGQFGFVVLGACVLVAAQVGAHYGGPPLLRKLRDSGIAFQLGLTAQGGMPMTGAAAAAAGSPSSRAASPPTARTPLFAGAGSK